MHTIKWKWRYTFNKNYKISQFNLEKNFKELKNKYRTGGESSDDEAMEVEADKIYRQHERTIKERANANGIHNIMTAEGRTNAALDYMHDNNVKQQVIDDDSDDVEFENAAIEEVEDQLLKAHKKSKKPLDPDVISKISATVSAIDLNESIVSTVQGKTPLHENSRYVRPG